MAGEELITPRLKSGRSPLVKTRDTEGFFDFDVQAETGGTPFPRHLFITKEGESYFQQLEKSAQGGRWENAHHAEADFERYKNLPPELRTKQLNFMWQGSPVAKTINRTIEVGGSFEDLKGNLKGQNTWRQISEGEPQVNLRSLPSGKLRELERPR